MCQTAKLQHHQDTSSLAAKPACLRATTPGFATTGDLPERKESYHRHPTSPYTWTSKCYLICEVWTASTKAPETAKTALLDAAQDWKLKIILGQNLIFPSEIVTTNLRPDLILCSTLQKHLYIVELTVPWEAAVEAYERKSLSYSDLAAETELCGCHTQVLPVEVGCSGFVATSTTRLLKSIYGPLSSHKMSVRGCGARQQLAVDEEKGPHLSY